MLNVLSFLFVYDFIVAFEIYNVYDFIVAFELYKNKKKLLI